MPLTPTIFAGPDWVKPVPAFVDAVALAGRHSLLAESDDERGRSVSDLHSRPVDSLAYAAGTYKVQPMALRRSASYRAALPSQLGPGATATAWAWFAL